MKFGSVLMVVASLGFFGCAAAPEEPVQAQGEQLSDVPCYASDDPDACYEAREAGRRGPSLPPPIVACFVGCPAGMIQTETCACIGTPVERNWWGDD